MRFPVFPDWLQWLVLLAVIWLWIQVGMLQASLTATKIKARFSNRDEVEKAYAKGSINRDEYERLKGRFSG